MSPKHILSFSLEPSLTKFSTHHSTETVLFNYQPTSYFTNQLYVTQLINFFLKLINSLNFRDITLTCFSFYITGHVSISFVSFSTYSDLQAIESLGCQASEFPSIYTHSLRDLLQTLVLNIISSLTTSKYLSLVQAQDTRLINTTTYQAASLG